MWAGSPGARGLQSRGSVTKVVGARFEADALVLGLLEWETMGIPALGCFLVQVCCHPARQPGGRGSSSFPRLRWPCLAQPCLCGAHQHLPSCLSSLGPVPLTNVIL